jgi:3-methyladenine DNA glycosylase/8-oxoguanine DNA glycosylase
MADNLSPDDLGIDLSSGKPQQLYRWFLASILFGKPIQQKVSADTYRVLIEHGFTSPKKFAGIAREPLRKLLDDGGYGRFDYQMADYLHATMAAVESDHGSIHRMVASAHSRDELAKTVQQFKGIGDTTAHIFTDAIPAAVIGAATADQP